MSDRSLTLNICDMAKDTAIVHGSETRVDTQKTRRVFWVNPPKNQAKKTGKKPTPNLIQ